MEGEFVSMSLLCAAVILISLDFSSILFRGIAATTGVRVSHLGNIPSNSFHFRPRHLGVEPVADRAVMHPSGSRRILDKPCLSDRRRIPAGAHRECVTRTNLDQGAGDKGFDIKAADSPAYNVCTLYYPPALFILLYVFCIIYFHLLSGRGNYGDSFCTNVQQNRLAVMRLH